jgi:hypothetical protein
LGWRQRIGGKWSVRSEQQRLNIGFCGVANGNAALTHLLNQSDERLLSICLGQLKAGMLQGNSFFNDTFVPDNGVSGSGRAF